MAPLPLLADPPQPVVVNAVTDRYRPTRFDQQKLAGLLAKRMRANSEGYLEHVELEGARGERSLLRAGRFLEASPDAYEYRQDEKLRAVMDRTAKLVMGSADEWADNQELIAQKHAVLGLLTYFALTDDDDALAAAKKIGDILLKPFSEGSGQEARRATALIEPLVALYRYTEEGRYLALARSAAEAWLQSKELHSEVSAENLSELNGLVELYRVTGDESYFRPLPAVWSQVRNNGLSLTGSPISTKNEGDACATLAWTQLTLNLLRVTGDAQYAEQLERTIYNQLFAAQDTNTGAILAPAPLNGSKQRAANSDPCGACESQALALIPAAVWGRYGNGIAIALYNPGHATFELRRRGTVQIYSEATFPESGDFLLHVEPAHNLRFPLRLRVPEWTSKFAVDFAGSHLLGKPGEFLTINREWKPGDTVKISMDMTVRTPSGSASHLGEVAIERGPQVLALAKALNPHIKDLDEAWVLTYGGSQPKLTPVEARLLMNGAGDQAYTIAGEYQGKSQQLVLAPFADAKTYRVWLKKIGSMSGASAGTN